MRDTDARKHFVLYLTNTPNPVVSFPSRKEEICRVVVVVVVVVVVGFVVFSFLFIPHLSVPPALKSQLFNILRFYNFLTYISTLDVTD